MKIWSWYRFLLHIPVGVTIYKLGKKNPAAAVSLTALFIAYEQSEQSSNIDRAYPDYQGAAFGVGLAKAFDWGK